MKFKAEELRDILDGDDVVSDVLSGHRRWSVDHRLVFRKDGKFYQTRYSVGATEMQEESPWQDETEVECQEVIQVVEPAVVFKPAQEPGEGE